ncbi:MAG: hypothetical protein AAF170_19705, partial [Bacteroidota bacterium]
MRLSFVFALAFLVAGCAANSDTPADAPAESEPTAEAYEAASDTLRFTGEAHLRNIRQLTFGGNNAE